MVHQRSTVFMLASALSQSASWPGMALGLWSIQSFNVLDEATTISSGSVTVNSGGSVDLGLHEIHTIRRSFFRQEQRNVTHKKFGILELRAVIGVAVDD
jgi:hypothetical protein